MIGVGLAIALGVLVLVVIVSRMGSGGNGITAQVAAATAKYVRPSDVVGAAPLVLDQEAVIQVVAPGPGQELTVWLEHAITKSEETFASSDWELSVALGIDGAIPQRVELAYDGEDVVVTPRQIGLTGMPSQWPEGGSGKTRIATLPASAPGTRHRVTVKASAKQPLKHVRLAAEVWTGRAPGP